MPEMIAAIKDLTVDKFSLSSAQLLSPSFTNSRTQDYIYFVHVFVYDSEMDPICKHFECYEAIFIPTVHIAAAEVKHLRKHEIIGH
jgi:hypothetical protein